MKKILFNATTNIVGGGVKNSAIFVNTLIDRKIQGWGFALSQPVANLVSDNEMGNDIFVFNTSPAKSFSSRRKLLKLVKERQYDAVYTMAGPAYISFPCLHIMGISNPYLTHSTIETTVYGCRLVDGVKRILHIGFQMYFAANADFFLFQTQSSRAGFCNKYKILNERTEVIANAYDNNLQNTNAQSDSDTGKTDKLVVLCPGVGYPHKAFDTIPNLINELVLLDSSMKDRVQFYLTLDPMCEVHNKVMKLAQLHGVSNMIHHLGSYSYKEVYSVYSKASVVYVPSILETFSATYLEAFTMGKPLIACDRDFARDVCGEAALYVNPLSPKAAAARIYKFLFNQEEQKYCVERGYEMLKKYGSQAERVDSILGYIYRLL